MHGHRFNQEFPKRVEYLSQNGVVVMGVACGQQHTVCWTTDGYVYSSGLGSFGQLGHGQCIYQKLLQFIQTLFST